MNLLFPILLRLTTGFLLASGLTTLYGSDASPLAYLVALFVTGGLSAALLDGYDHYLIQALQRASALLIPPLRRW